MKTIFTAVLMVGLAEGFAPMTTSRGISTSLQGAFDGQKFDITRNPYARGGKESWEFELDTMYVEEPKKKVVPAKKAPAKKIAAKKAPAKKIVAKKAPAKKAASPFSLFGKNPEPEPVKKAPKNPFAALFQK